MAIGIGGYSAIWGPFAMTIVVGLITSTILTLFVLPLMYSVVIDVTDVVRRIFGVTGEEEDGSSGGSVPEPKSGGVPAPGDGPLSTAGEDAASSPSDSPG